MRRFQLHRYLLPLFSIGCLLCSGCGEFGNVGMNEAIQQVGAKVVEGSSDEALLTMFEKANAACPRRMDAYTTLVEVQLIDPGKAEFHYVVNDQGKTLVKKVSKRALEKAAVEHMRGNAMAVAVAERDLTVEHIYEDKRGRQLLSYTINREVLQENLGPRGMKQAVSSDVKTVKAGSDDLVVDADVGVDESESEKTPARIVKPPMPKQFRAPKRNKSNPAGVQGNPFFSET